MACAGEVRSCKGFVVLDRVFDKPNLDLPLQPLSSIDKSKSKQESQHS